MILIEGLVFKERIRVLYLKEGDYFRHSEGCANYVVTKEVKKYADTQTVLVYAQRVDGKGACERAYSAVFCDYRKVDILHRM